MTIDEFDAALHALGWKVSDFCRATGLHRNTPVRWRSEGVEIPMWVSKHLGLLLELRRLNDTYLTASKEELSGRVDDGVAAAKGVALNE